PPEHIVNYPAALIAPASANDPAALAERGEERTALLLALAELTPKQREAVTLRYYFGFRDAEIAAIVGCRPGAVSEPLPPGLHAWESFTHPRSPWLLNPSPPTSPPVLVGGD